MLSFIRSSTYSGSIFKYLAVFLFFLFFFISFIRIPVHSYDFWWHLATGKYIVENHSLPQHDPFAYTSHETPTERKMLILKGNWLADVIFYSCYSLWDVKGIIILRSLLLLFFLFIIFLTIKRQNASILVSLILVALVFLLSLNSTTERPQLFTFLIFSLTYYLLEEFRIDGSQKVFLIPLLALILSNIHPGYIVIILLVSLYLAGEGIRCVINRDFLCNTLKILLIVWFLTIIFSCLNPNGWYGLKNIFSTGSQWNKIVEWMSPFTLYSRKMRPISYPYILFLLLSLLSFRYFRKIGITHTLLLITFSFMSFLSVRYVIFYMSIAAPILAKIVITIREERIFRKFSSSLESHTRLLYLIACIFGIFFLLNKIPGLSQYKFKEATFHTFPKSAANFLNKLETDGNMFNDYGFGGYLIWKLYPDKKVFIDGRILEPAIYQEYLLIGNATEKPEPSWKQLIDKYNISYIIFPPLTPKGVIVPLVEALIDSKHWILIYSDHLSLIFFKNNLQNRELIMKYALNKKEALNTIVTQASAMAIRNKLNPNYPLSIGKAFFKMGKFDNAKKAFLMAYNRDPENKLVKEWLKRLEKVEKILKKNQDG